MKERPILFSAPMVNAILQGRKTQTRRVIKNLDGIWRLVETNYSKEEPNKAFIQDQYGDYHPMPCPFGRQGDRLWVRETFATDSKSIWYRADNDPGPANELCVYPDGTIFEGKWKPSIFMPRWASRITLEVVNVRVERVQEISEEDAKSEGVYFYGDDDPDQDDYRNYLHKPDQCDDWGVLTAKQSFETLWESINGKKHPWNSNPWVWVPEFRRITS